MALNIKSPAADRLARQVAAQTGESITDAVIIALSERLARLARRPGAMGRRLAISEIRERVSALPERDGRTDEEILGYNDNGAFG